MRSKILLGIIICVLVVGTVIFATKVFNFNDIGKENSISNKVNNNSNDKVDNNSNNKVDNDLEDNKDNLSDDIIGKWDTVSAVNSEDGKETKNLKDVFGSSYSQYGSYLELKEDGTFIDAIQPISNGTKSNTGEYTIKRNYNKPGDCYVFLSYSDGTEGKLQRVFLDESNTYYLVLDGFINGYQLTLRKN